MATEWTPFPGGEDRRRAILMGYLVAYVEPHTHDGRETLRWSIWFHGTLLGQGFISETDQWGRREAERQAGYEADRIDQRIRERVRTMDVRNRGEA